MKNLCVLIFTSLVLPSLYTEKLESYKSGFRAGRMSSFFYRLYRWIGSSSKSDLTSWKLNPIKQENASAKCSVPSSGLPRLRCSSPSKWRARPNCLRMPCSIARDPISVSIDAAFWWSPKLWNNIQPIVYKQCSFTNWERVSHGIIFVAYLYTYREWCVRSLTIVSLEKILDISKLRLLLTFIFIFNGFYQDFTIGKMYCIWILSSSVFFEYLSKCKFLQVMTWKDILKM